MKIAEPLHFPLMLAAFGLVFFAAGLALAYDTWRKDVDLAGRLRAAPVVDAANIGAQQVGATVLVEGTVAARNPVIESGLVTLLRQEAEFVTSAGSSTLRRSWKTLRAEARPLWIDTPAGAVAIVNTDYAWRDSPRRVPEDPGTVTAGTPRTIGFGVGDTIVAHAVVVTHEGAAALRAVEIDGGTRDAYLFDKQSSDWIGYIMGGVFALVGLAMLVSGGIGIRRASAALVRGAAG